MEKWKKQEMYKKYCKDLGLKVQTSVNSVTDYLVIGECPGPLKLSLAKEKNIKIIKETEFFVMLKEKHPEYFL